MHVMSDQETASALFEEAGRLRDENYALKLAAAGGEDVPGSASMVTPADVASWREEAWRRERALEARVRRLQDFVNLFCEWYDEDGDKDAAAAIVETYRQDGEAISCAARRQGSAGGNDPAECDWPVCGCDPYADKVIAALQESGRLPDRIYPDWPMLRLNPQSGAIETVHEPVPSLPAGWRMINVNYLVEGGWVVNLKGPRPMMKVRGVGNSREIAWNEAVAIIKDRFPVANGSEL